MPWTLRFLCVLPLINVCIVAIQKQLNGATFVDARAKLGDAADRLTAVDHRPPVHHESRNSDPIIACRSIWCIVIIKYEIAVGLVVGNADLLPVHQIRRCFDHVDLSGHT